MTETSTAKQLEALADLADLLAHISSDQLRAVIAAAIQTLTQDLIGEARTAANMDAMQQVVNRREQLFRLWMSFSREGVR